MALLTAVQTADLWLGAGGPKNRVVEWVAIAIGESGLVTDAVSSAGAIGMWQIMPFNAPAFGYTAADLYDPAVNARVAVAMSGGGTNCAAWDSCYLNIRASGRYTFLSWPEQGSADYNNLAVAAAELDGHVTAPISNPHFPGVAQSLPGAVADLQQLAARSVPAVTLATIRTTRQVSAVGRRGWRP